MPTLLYALLSWTTLERRELIDARGADFLRGFIPRAARRYGVEAIAVGVVHDQVHVLLLLPPVVDMPRVVQGLKGASARIANRDGVIAKGPLRWAKGYDLRSVSPNALLRVTAYVQHKAQRHPALAIN